jgi:hypothetical protein
MAWFANLHDGSHPAVISFIPYTSQKPAAKHRTTHENAGCSTGKYRKKAVNTRKPQNTEHVCKPEWFAWINTPSSHSLRVHVSFCMVVGLKFQFNDALLDQTLFLMEHSDAPQGLTVTVSHIDTQDKGGIVEFRY